MTAFIRVISPGFLSTLQDLGRNGFQKYGIPVSGAMDDVSHRFANFLVGNAPDTTSLEMTLVGPSLYFETAALISVCGYGLQPMVQGNLLPLGCAIFIPKNTVLNFKSNQRGVRAYLAVHQGIQVNKFLGSSSTYVKAGFGGIDGRMLQKNDRVPIHNVFQDYDGLPTLPVCSKSRIHTNAFFPIQSEFRFLPGRWFERLPPNYALFHTPYRIDQRSDRTGIRLNGKRLQIPAHLNNLLSEGVSLGEIQVPPSGQPIILTADRQTTGGYLSIGTIISVDFPKLVQLVQNAPVRFSVSTIEHAQTLHLYREKNITVLKKETATRFSQFRSELLSMVTALA